MKNKFLFLVLLFSTIAFSQSTTTPVGSLRINNTPVNNLTAVTILVRNADSKMVESIPKADLIAQIQATLPPTATNIAIGNRNANTLDVLSSTGTGFTFPTVSTTEAGIMPASDKSKLDGIATGATANSTDAQLRDRATHTGVQAISTVTGLQGALDSKQPSGDYVTSTGVGASGTWGINASGLGTYSWNPSIVSSGVDFLFGRNGSNEIKIVNGDAVKSWLGLGSNAYTSTAYAPIASPTFTGTVGGITKAMVGLGNVDNTTDLNKPISTATQTALNNKQVIGDYATNSTVSNGLATKVDKVTEKSLILDTEITRLATVQTNATANSTDAQLRDRATHTGVQAIGTVTGLQGALDAKANLSGGNIFNGNQIINGTTQVTSGNPIPLSGSVGLYTSYNGNTSFINSIFPNVSWQKMNFGASEHKFKINDNDILGITANGLNVIGDVELNGAVKATNYIGSASLTGTPTAPTATVGSAGNQIANKDYVLAIASPKENLSNKTSDVASNIVSTEKYVTTKGVADYTYSKTQIDARISNIRQFEYNLGTLTPNYVMSAFPTELAGKKILSFEFYLKLKNDSGAILYKNTSKIKPTQGLTGTVIQIEGQTVSGIYAFPESSIPYKSINSNNGTVLNIDANLTASNHEVIAVVYFTDF